MLFKHLLYNILHRMASESPFSIVRPESVLFMLVILSENLDVQNFRTIILESIYYFQTAYNTITKYSLIVNYYSINISIGIKIITDNIS